MSSVGITVTLGPISSWWYYMAFPSLFLPHVPGCDTLRLIFTIINSFLLYLFALLAAMVSIQLTHWLILSRDGSVKNLT